jgi:signal transduction histidine kinase
MGLANLDLLTVGVVVAATGALGFTVYFSDRASATNRTFLWFSIITALWGVVNYLSYQFSDPTLTLWLLRGIIFFAAFQAFFLYEFFTVFPDRVRSYSWRHTYLLLPLVGAAAIVTLTPLAFSGFVGSVAAGQVAVVSKGPGLALFVLVAVGLVVRALWLLFRTLRKSTGEAREAVRLVLIGTAITFALIIFFNLILSIVFTNPRFVPLGALFMFPFIAFASYAILRDHLFNIKVVGTTFLVLILSIVSFADIIFSNTLPEVLLRVGVFILVLVFGVSLIRGVLREVEQRERIEKLAAELQETNARQEGLIHFIGHEVKGFLTKAQGVFSLMEEGELGPVPETMKPFVLRGLADTKDGVESVSDILKASNLKKGTVSYEKKPFDLAALVKEMVEKEKPTAEATPRRSPTTCSGISSRTRSTTRPRGASMSRSRRRAGGISSPSRTPVSASARRTRRGSSPRADTARIPRR